MTENIPNKIKPSRKEFLKYIAKFRRYVKRDAMYKVAMRLVRDSWGDWSDVADGLGVLLLTWNQAFYRYGKFSFDRLEQFLKKRKSELKQFRNRKIESLAKSDEKKIKGLFKELLSALTSEGKDNKFRRSPVAVAKALHIIASNFFPLWDNKIAKAYGSHWGSNKKAVDRYISFCWKNKEIVEYLKRQKIPKDNKSWLKLIDEYNFARFTLK